MPPIIKTAPSGTRKILFISFAQNTGPNYKADFIWKQKKIWRQVVLDDTCQIDLNRK